MAVLLHKQARVPFIMIIAVCCGKKNLSQKGLHVSIELTRYSFLKIVNCIGNMQFCVKRRNVLLDFYFNKPKINQIFLNHPDFSDSNSFSLKLGTF